NESSRNLWPERASPLSLTSWLTPAPIPCMVAAQFGSTMSIETTASFLEGVTRAHSATTPCLIVGVRCAEPLASACLYALRDVEELNIGRGERPELRASSSSKALQLEIPDRWMSAGHAQLACKGSTWALV